MSWSFIHGRRTKFVPRSDVVVKLRLVLFHRTQVIPAGNNVPKFCSSFVDGSKIVPIHDSIAHGCVAQVVVKYITTKGITNTGPNVVPPVLCTNTIGPDSVPVCESISII